MINEFFTVEEVAEILDVYEISARELLEGIIRFTRGELETLAKSKNLPVEALTL